MDSVNKRTARSQSWTNRKAAPKGKAKPNSRGGSGGAHFITHRQLNGGRIVPGENPPDVNFQPWSKITVVKQFSGELTVNLGTIGSAFKTQMDPKNTCFKTDSYFQFKLTSFRAWNLTGRTISMTAHDFISPNPTGADQLCGLVDVGSPSHTPAVGFYLPSAHRQHCLRTDTTTGTDLILDLAVAKQDSGILYVDCFYRFDGPSKLSFVNQPSDKITKLLSDSYGVQVKSHTLNRQMKEVLSKLKEIADNTYASRPSTLKKVIQGVEYLALAITAVGDEGLSDDSISMLSDYVANLDVDADGKDSQ